MKIDTPYRERPPSERNKELACMRSVLTGLNKPDHIFEPFGGIGMVTELIRELYPDALLTSTELDEHCVDEARARDIPGAAIFQGDCFNWLHRPGFSFDAAVLDFNKCTYRDLTHIKDGAFQKNVVSAVMQRSPKWIELTDSACSKLHLNWRSYQLGSNSWSEYLDQLNRWFRDEYKYRLMRVSKHHAAAYLVFVPDLD